MQNQPYSSPKAQPSNQKYFLSNNKYLYLQKLNQTQNLPNPTSLINKPVSETHTPVSDLSTTESNQNENIKIPSNNNISNNNNNNNNNKQQSPIEESLPESYFETEIVNLKEDNNEKNIYFDEIFDKTKSQKQKNNNNNNINTEIIYENDSSDHSDNLESVISDEIYMVKNKDTGEKYDMRSQDLNQSMILSANTVKLSGKPWAEIRKISRKINEAFWDAVEKGELNKVKELLDEKKQMYPAQVNSSLLDDWTALHLVAKEGHFEICEFLLRKNANLEAKTTMSRTALHIACLSGNFHIVKLLVDSGANINAADKDFNTPLHFVSEHGHIDILNYLMKKKASYKMRNHAGLTPVDIALNNNIRKIFETYGVFNDEFINSFGRNSMDGLILFTSRIDMINKLIYAINKTAKLQEPMKPVPRLSKVEKRIYTKLIEKFKLQKSGSQSFENSDKILRISINPNCKDFDEKVGPQSFNCLYMLGKGSFGEVYLVEKISSKRLYAMKILKKDLIVKQNLTRYAKTERNVLSIMNHPFIVRLNFAFQTDTKLYLLLDYCPGGDLGNLITKKKRLKESVARIYAAEVLLALEELHKNNIIFRDLKPDNVVIDSEGHALLTDFGLSKEGVDTNLSRSFCGSVAYLAPEMLRKAGHNKTVDWYLFGVLIYEMVVGIPPYFDPDKEKLFMNIEKGDLKLLKSFSPELKKLIIELLRRDPDQRLGSKKDAEEVKNHPWFQSINWDDVYKRKLKPPTPDIRDFDAPMMNPNIQDSLPTKDKSMDYVPDWSFTVPEERRSIMRRQ